MPAARQLGLLWGGVALALVALAPVARELAAALPACPFKIWLTVPCLTCGATRAALALARFDLGAALTLNPLATVGWIGLVGGGVAAGGLALAGRPLPVPHGRPTLTARLILALAILANWAYLIAAGV